MKRRENNKVIDKTILINLYDIHSMNEMCKILDIGRIRLEKLFKEYGIEKKTMSEIQNKKTVKDKIKKTVNDVYGDNWGFNGEKYKNAVNKKYGGNPAKNNTIKEKMKETNLVRYGVLYFTQTDAYKIKSVETNLVKYGTTNPSINNEVKDKIKLTKLLRYGNSNFNNINKQKLTILAKYGVGNISQIPWVAEKIFKNGFKAKEYKFPSGRTDLVLGYEHHMLNILINDDKLDENDILTNFNCPFTSWYDENNIEHKHIPDIYIKSKNQIIEVKSEYTASEKFLDVILTKKKFAIEAGFNYKICVIDRKTKKIKYEIN